MSARRPSFQFYPADWLGNTNLRRCTHAEKGAWLDVMCLLHDSSDQYGALRWPLADIALAAGCDVATLQALIDKGVMKGADAGQTCEVFVYVPRSGRKDGEPVTLIAEQEGPLWYSSRMVRDEYVNHIRGGGSRFGSPTRRVGERQGVHPTHHPYQHPGHHPTFTHNGDSAGDEHEKPAKPQDSSAIDDFSSPTRRVGEEIGERQGDGSSTSSSASQEERQDKPATRSTAKQLTFAKWADAERSAGRSLIADWQPLERYMASTGLPDELVQMAWTAFKDRYTNSTNYRAKKYIDWRDMFLNAIKGNWFKLWFVSGDGSYSLTTAGQQAQREQAAEVVE